MILPVGDKDWIAVFRQGDGPADGQLFSFLFRPLCFYAERITGSRPEAEDIVVDSFLKCYRRRDQFDTLEHIRSFLYLTVKNASLDYLAAEKRHDRSHREWQSRLENAGQPVLVEDALIRTEVLGEIFNEVEALPPRCREIIRLIFKEDLSTDEIAERLGIDRQNVRSQKARGLQLLRSRLLARDSLGIIFLSILLMKHSSNS
jgi:RNA polymerase sigma factor (sigma-70 family)